MKFGWGKIFHHLFFGKTSIHPSQNTATINETISVKNNSGAILQGTPIEGPEADWLGKMGETFHPYIDVFFCRES